MERFKIFKDNSLKNKIAIIFDNKFILDDAKNIEIIRVRIDRARTKYERICELAKKEYDSILRLENDKYKNGERLFFREYDEKVKPLERNYYKVRSYLEKKFDSETERHPNEPDGKRKAEGPPVLYRMAAESCNLLGRAGRDCQHLFCAKAADSSPGSRHGPCWCGRLAVYHLCGDHAG